jgi:predicted nucleic acid-binding protein
VATIEANAKIYVDANVFIYFLEGSVRFEEAAKRFFLIADDRNASLSTSEVTLAECLFGAHRLGSDALARAYIDLLDRPALLRLLRVDRAILELAAAMGAKVGAKLIDAIHLASAVSAGCDTFVTNDKSIRAPKGLRIVQLMEIES